MKAKCLKAILIFAGALFLLFNPISSKADTFTFDKITNNGGADLSGQLTVDVTASGTGASFLFHNAVDIASNVSEIYFDDGALLALSTVINSVGADFSQGAIPAELPGGNSISPPFVTTATFLASANKPAPSNGLNSTDDYVEILFTLPAGMDIDDVIAALNNGGLRIGLHVTGIYPTDKSDSYVNNGPVSVPEPGILILLGIAMSAVGIVSRYVRKI